MKKLKLCSLIVCCIAMLIFMGIAASAEVSASGNCGDDLTWSLDSDGTLTISGSGDIAEYDWSSNAPWYEYRESVKKIVIGEGVTRIGSYAFCDCDAVSVSIPKSVRSIGYYAFGNCEELKSVYITDLKAWCETDIYDINSSPFYYATELYLNGKTVTEIAIPDGVSEIGDYAFGAMDFLTSVSIPDSVTSIGKGSFFACVNLKSISIPKSVTAIGGYAFTNCESLKSVTVPASVRTLSKYTFNGCTTLESVTLPVKLEKIEENALSRSGIKSLTVPDSVKVIEGAAFWCCEALESVKLPEKLDTISYNMLYGCKSLREVNIPSAVKLIDGYAFAGCSSLKELVLPDGLEAVKDNAFYNCTSLSSINMPYSVTEIGREIIANTAYCKDKANYEDGILYLGRHLITVNEDVCGDITVKDGIISIAPSAFIDPVEYAGAEALTGITLPASVKTIGDRAFYACKALKYADLSKTQVTKLDDYTFADCTALTEVLLPEGLKHFITGVFSDCTSLAEIEIPDGIKTMGVYTFDDCSSLTRIDIPEGVEIVKAYMFKDCTSLREVKLPSTLKVIDELAFSGCTSLVDIELPNGLYAIEYGAFMDSGLTSLNIPDSVKVYHDEDIRPDYSSVPESDCVYKDGVCYSKDMKICYNIPGEVLEKGISIPEGVEIIASGAFAGFQVRSVGNLTLPRSLKYIGSQTWDGASVYFTGNIYCYEGSYADEYFKHWMDDIIVYIAEEEDTELTFTDVKAGAWYEDAVSFVVSKGYMKGMSETVFSPNSSITREQFVLILANMADVDTNEYKHMSSGFTDVKTGLWYSGAVTWAVREGYVSGMSPTKFGTGQSIQRAALARLLYAYAEKNGMDTTGRADLSAFGDAKEFEKAGNAWMVEPVQWAVDAGIISGMKVDGVNCVNPKGTATRAQAARMLMVFDENK